MNYLKLVEDELAKCKQRIIDLEATKRVLLALGPVYVDTVKEHKPAHAPVKVRKTRRMHVLKDARRLVIAFLEKQPEPVRGYMILNDVMAGGKIGDSTCWRALKELRDEGRINWDTESRLYSVVREMKKVAS